MSGVTQHTLPTPLGLGKPRGARVAPPPSRSSPPGDYKPHPALRSCTLRQSKMADAAATAGAGSSGTVRAGGARPKPRESGHSVTFP